MYENTCEDYENEIKIVSLNRPEMEVSENGDHSTIPSYTSKRKISVREADIGYRSL